ncbi:MAG: cytochrome oxidase subunit III [Bacteroidetes bacterium B1(2017)]|nr:MAG: cytochrome oxidase subunit III [Bacteroidetes bacterium B1(2017)]
MQSSILQKEEENYVIHPKKFVLWLFIVASVMLFAGFTSAYIVRRGEGNWEIFNLPSLFNLNTLLIILSSISIQLSYSAAKNNQFAKVKTFIGIAFLLGIGFCFGQWFAWKQLIADNVFFAFSNPSNSFVYVISGVHLFHVIGGLVFMSIMLVQALQNKIGSSTHLFLNMCITYWHFIGILWIYLYLFLYLYR